MTDDGAHPSSTASLLAKWAPRLVVLCGVAGVIGHQVAFYDWFIEDAAISFAYAKNLAAGEGLVAYAGGERVEGYSNFTWVVLLSLFEAVGLSSFTVAKWLSFVIGAATVPVVYALTREIYPSRRAPAVLAVLALAANSQFAHWGASGLENPVFGLCLALALWRTSVEWRTSGWPWSAFWYFLLAITRPEGIMYGAFAGFLAMNFTLRDGRGLGPTLRWLVTFFLPWGAYQSWRFQYFSWEFPNTYYGKMNNKEPDPFAWNKRGWRYVRNWAHFNWQGYLLPIYVLGLVGGKHGWRTMAAVATAFIASFGVWFGTHTRALFPVFIVCTLLMFYAAYRAESGRPRVRTTVLALLGTLVCAGSLEMAQYMATSFWEMETLFAEPLTPSWWAEVPPYTFIFLAAALPFLSRGTTGAYMRVTCWTLCTLGLFFGIYVQGDWMANWRWMSLIAVPLSVLFGLGATHFADTFQSLFQDRKDWGIPGTAMSVVVLGLLAGANIAQTARAKRDTGPYSVKKRVEYMQKAARRLHIEERVVDLDVDMGAHMYWSDFAMMDIAGLVDIPMAQHKFERAFIQEYLFEERKPHFAHVHGGWATNSKIPTHAPWRQHYVEIPGYPVGRDAFHVGNHVRKDLIVAGSWPHSQDRKVVFESGVTLEGWHIPAGEAAERRMFYLEVGVSTPHLKASEDFRMLAFLAHDHELLTTWELPPGYDWMEPHTWGRKKVFHGKFSLPMSSGVPLGEHEVGFVFIDGSGEVMLPELDPSSLPERTWQVGGEELPSALADGEVRFGRALRVTSLEEREEASLRDVEQAIQMARDGACEEAEKVWWNARYRRPQDRSWIEGNEVRIARPLARCWLGAAQKNPEQVVELIEQSRTWKAHLRDLPRFLEPFVEERLERGEAAMASEDWEEAYRMFTEVLRLDPSVSYARRRAETARSWRLGIGPASDLPEEVNRPQVDPREPEEPTPSLPSKQGSPDARNQEVQ